MRFNHPLQGEYIRASVLFESLNRLHRIWMSFSPPPPLKRSDLMMLGAVLGEEQHGKGPPTASRLARHTHQSLPGVSQKLGQLEEQGYLQRSTSPADRRAVQVQLTEKGRSTAEGMLRGVLSRVERAFDTLGPEKTDALTQLLAQLCDAFDAAEPSATPSNP